MWIGTKPLLWNATEGNTRRKRGAKRKLCERKSGYAERLETYFAQGIVYLGSIFYYGTSAERRLTENEKAERKGVWIMMNGARRLSSGNGTSELHFTYYGTPPIT